MAVDAEAQVVKLKYGTYAPQSVIDEPELWFINEVSRRTGIKIELETYFGGTLAKPPDCLDAIGKGVYDTGWISPIFTPAKTPLGSMVNATPIVVPNLTGGTAAANFLVRTFPPAAAEYQKSNVKVLFHTGVWNYKLITKKPVKSLDDIKGLRVRTFGYLSRAWAELGGVPVTISVAETYDALQKGTIDGALTGPVSMHQSLRLTEIAKNYFNLDLGCLPCPALMNLDVWNKLPDKVRKEMQNLERDMPKMVDQITTREELKAIESMKKEGVTVHEISAADKARIAEVGKVIAKIVVDDLTSKGVTNAKEAMDIYLTAIEKYEK
jgi:TRAP-type C4-dicarboxylate transport system substrate-binding protein